MIEISGTVGNKPVKASIEGKGVFFSNGTQMVELWFVYFQRVNKSLKTCDAVYFDGARMVEHTVSQKCLESISDAVDCVVYIGGPDPLPWKKLLLSKWSKEEWQHAFEDCDTAENSDDEWKPDSDYETEDSDEDSDDEMEN